MTVLLEPVETGGIPVSAGAMPGSMVTRAGHLQYGDMLLGADTTARWRQLVGWRDLPDAQVSDSPRPQAHGAYPGDVFGDALTVTFVFLLRGTAESKTAAVNALELYAPMDGVERALVVDDGDGPWLRMARVTGRQVPQDIHYRTGPVECSIQFLCADPRRYSVSESVGSTTPPLSSGGLAYPLDYPLEYGTSSGGGISASNAGSVPAPVVVTFFGPLTDPLLVCNAWSMGFNITLADGETLDVDSSLGTVLLNGTADRLYTIRNDASPLEQCVLPPGTTNLSLTAVSGSGRAEVTYRDARM